MSKITLRAIIADTSPDDAEHLTRLMRDSDYILKTQRVDSAASLEAALGNGEWDLVLAELSLGTMNVEQLLHKVQRLSPETLFFIVTRAIDDAECAKLMSLGARDVIFKGRWTRLMPAIERELRVRTERRQMQATIDGLRGMEERFEALAAGSLDAVCYCHDGIYVDANPSYLKLLGYQSFDEIRDIPVLNLIDKSDQGRFKGFLKNAASGTVPQEFIAVARDGNKRPVEIAISTVVMNGEECAQLMVKDISQRKMLETKLQFLHQKDALTGLCNRRNFTHELSKVQEQTRVGGEAAFILGMELHDLRDFNVTLGYPVCDRFLLTLARKMRDTIDASQRLARVGGGQFVALLENIGGADARYVQQQVEDAVKAMKLTDGGTSLPFRFTTRLHSLDEADSAEALLNIAFPPTLTPTAIATPASALDPEKISSTSASTPMPQAEPKIPQTSATAASPPPAVAPAVEVSTPAETPPHANSGPDWSTAIRTALASNGFHLAYQPLVNVVGEARELYEVLLSMDDGQGGRLAAADLMPSAIASQLAGKIDRYQAQTTIDYLARLRMDKRHASFFVTLSPAAIGDDVLLQAMHQQLKVTGLPAGTLYFQLDIELIAQNEDNAKNFIRLARKMGAGIVIDNFRANRLNNGQIASLEIDFAKIDCSDHSALQHNLSAAKAAGLRVIGKQVSSNDTFATLFMQGAEYAQGDALAAATAEANFRQEDEQTLSSDSVPAFGIQLRG